MPPGVSAQTGRVPSPRALAAAARLPPTLCPVWIKGRRATLFEHGPRWVLYGRNRIWIFSPYKNLYQIDQRVQSIFPKNASTGIEARAMVDHGL